MVSSKAATLVLSLVAEHRPIRSRPRTHREVSPDASNVVHAEIQTASIAPLTTTSDLKYLDLAMSVTANSQSAKLSSLKLQRQNANAHTERGLDLLSKSIQDNGWIGAITVAADGETFDGSARIEVGVDRGFEDAIIVESDGKRPVVVKRTDIPNADDPRAIELGLAANRIAQVDLAWDINVLAEMKSEGVATEKLWTDKEWNLLVPEEVGSADADVSLDRAAELQKKWGTETGQLWLLGSEGGGTGF